MWTINVRLGVAEFATFFLLLAVALVVAVAFRAGGLWPVALVPGLTYILAIGAAYALYRRYASEQAGASQSIRAAASFRVVDVRGECPLGRRKGDLVSVDRAGSVVPQLCQPAERVLRMAASDDEGPGTQRWCCPVYDHLLVFQRTPAAA